MKIFDCEKLDNPPVGEFDLSDMNDFHNVHIDRMRVGQWYKFTDNENKEIFIKLTENDTLIQTRFEPQDEKTKDSIITKNIKVEIEKLLDGGLKDKQEIFTRVTQILEVPRTIVRRTSRKLVRDMVNKLAVLQGHDPFEEQ